MQDAGVGWCDRCRVLALHEPGASPTTIHALWETCAAGGLSGNAVGPAPEASLRLDANTCTACPVGSTSDANGVCQPCLGTVVGNVCLQCASDVVLDGAVDAFGDKQFATTFSAPGDNCPTVFWAEIRNGSQAFARNADYVQAILSGDKTGCNQPLSLNVAGITPGGFDTIRTNSVATGWHEPGCPPSPTPSFCFAGCFNAPKIVFNAATELPTGTFRFGTPSVTGMTITVGFDKFTIVH